MVRLLPTLSVSSLTVVLLPLCAKLRWSQIPLTHWALSSHRIFHCCSFGVSLLQIFMYRCGHLLLLILQVPSEKSFDHLKDWSNVLSSSHPFLPCFISSPVLVLVVIVLCTLWIPWCKLSKWYQMCLQRVQLDHLTVFSKLLWVFIASSIPWLSSDFILF